MYDKIIKAFIFNRTVLGLCLGACFLITGLDLYIDSAQSKFLRFSALQIAHDKGKIFSQLASQGESLESLNSLLDEDSHLERIQESSLKDDFQKKAFATLSQNPIESFSKLETRPHLIFRYAFNTSLGFLELDISLNALEDMLDRQSLITLWVCVILGGLAVIALSIFFGYFRLSTETLIETQQRALDYQRKLTSSYERFFPQKFLHLLKKNSVLDICLGDSAEREMAVLFSDIRNFTGMVERKTPAESFQFLNDYLREAGPIIRKNGGFIDKYLGDGILALFDSTDDALLSTLDIMQRLGERAKKVSDPSVIISEIRVGMHFGPLIVGTVGEEERMDGTVISDIVNSASRLEELNKIYQTHILVSEQFVQHLQKKERFKIRFIDHVYAVGKKEGIRIFEVFNMDPVEIIEKKERMEGDFQKAMECYRLRQFPGALEYLQNCFRIYPEDKVVDIFISRTKALIQNPPDERWSFITRLSYKDSL
jgi:class 3 adenylate cyclase